MVVDDLEIRYDGEELNDPDECDHENTTVHMTEYGPDGAHCNDCGEEW